MFPGEFLLFRLPADLHILVVERLQLPDNCGGLNDSVNGRSASVIAPDLITQAICRCAGLVEMLSQFLNGGDVVGLQEDDCRRHLLQIVDLGFCLSGSRPVSPPVMAERHIGGEDFGKVLFLRLLRRLLPDFFREVGQPVFQIPDDPPDGVKEAVGGYDVPVQVAEIGLYAPAFHSGGGRAEVDLRGMGIVLPFKGAQIDTLLPASRFKVSVLYDLPFMPPYLAVLLLVPVNGVDPPAFPFAVFHFDALAVFIKDILFAALRLPAALLVHWAEGEQDMGVGVAVTLVVNGKIGNHAPGDELRLAVFPHEPDLFFP